MHIYLDYNATTPVDEAVLAEMLPYFSTTFGNAASNTHAWGWKAAEAVKIARTRIADALGAAESEIVFTSGATEAINLAIKGVAEVYGADAPKIITTQTEHKAVLDTCAYLEAKGFEVVYLPVDAEGLVQIANLEAAIDDKTMLVCVMMVNNETGVIQPIRKIAEIAHAHGALMMSDCVQAMGKMALNVNEYGIDLMPISAHKLYGPKGVGALYVRRRSPRVRLEAQIHGGGHENNKRSGTLNVPGIVGLGKAVEIAEKNREREAVRIQALRDKLEQGLLAFDTVTRNGSAIHRLYNVSNLTLGEIPADTLMGRIPHIAFSSGSACTSALATPSHVLTAMGRSETAAYASIRLSLGRYTTEAEVDAVIVALGQFLR